MSENIIEIGIEDLDISHRLEKLPSLIKDEETKILAFQRKFEAQKLKRKEIEIKIKSEIGKELTEDFKPKFKNEDAREAELIERLKKNIEVSVLKSEQDDTEYKLDIEKIKFNYLINLFSGAKAIAHMKEME